MKKKKVIRVHAEDLTTREFSFYSHKYQLDGHSIYLIKEGTIVAYYPKYLLVEIVEVECV